MKKIILLLILVITLSGCQSMPASYTVLAGGPGHLDGKASDNHPSDAITQANHKLGQTMLSYFAQADENTFVSPLSLQLALAMTLNGATDATLAQMQAALHVQDLPLDEINQQFKQLQLNLLETKGIEFKLNNSIWMRDEFQEHVHTSFLDTNQTYYGPFVATGDFSQKSFVDSINKWVAKHTNNTIKEAVKYPVAALTQMLLINTLYFKGDWALPFPKENTAQRSFLDFDVETMANIAFFNYFEAPDAQYISLPYKDSDVVMIVGLPKADAIITIEDLLHAHQLASSHEVDLQMPKLKTELTYDLNDFLIDHKMEDAFDPFRANFSAMADNALQNGLHISSVVQKTFIAIDEKGTEAAAMTKVEMKELSMPSPAIQMHINRPYTFIIYDHQLDTIHFVGHIVNPGD